MDRESRDALGQTMAAIAAQSGAVLHAYPRPGLAVRRIVLRDIRGDQGTQFEAGQLEDDGTLRVVDAQRHGQRWPDDLGRTRGMPSRTVDRMWLV